MQRELSSSQTRTRGLARSRNRWIALVRFFFVFSLIATGFSGLAPVVGVRTLETAQANHSNIKLPVPSGESWTISQGYNTNPANGGSHYSCNPETLRDEPSGTRTCSQY